MTDTTVTTGARPAKALGAKAWFRGDVDGLRAIAIVLVVAYHAHVPFFGGGFVGVDVFFVISGFLISRNLLRESETRERIGLGTFWARRIRRLVPALALVILATLAAGYVILPLFDLNDFAKQGAAAALYVSNMFFAVQAENYFAADVGASPFLHTWSLGVEEQFYLVWPLLFAGACLWGSRFIDGYKSRARRRVLIGAFAVTLVVSFALNIVLTRSGSTWAFFGLPARAWEFGVAGLLAALPLPRLLRSVGARTVAAVVGLVLLAIATVTLSDSTAYPGVYALIPVAAAVLLIVAGETWDGEEATAPVSRVLSTGPMQWVGRVSYSWYLWHWPAIVLTVVAVERDTVAVRSAAALATLPIAFLAYRFYETPLRFAPFVSRSNWRTYVFGAGVTGLVLLAAFGVHSRAEAGQGGPQSLEQRVAEVVAEYKDRSENGCQDTTQTTADGDAYCVVGDPNGTRTVLLIGDSHAGQWRNTLDAIAAKQGVRLLVRQHRCPVYPVAAIDAKAGYPELDDCRTKQQGDMRLIDALKPDAIIVASWSGYADALVDDAGNPLPADQIGPAWEAGAREFISSAQSKGIKVGVVLDEPTLPVNASQCIVSKNSITACEVASSTDFVSASSSQAERRVVDELGDIPTVDMVAQVCDVDTCRLEIDGILVYVDTNHLSEDFAHSRSDLMAGLVKQLVGT